MSWLRQYGLVIVIAAIIGHAAFVYYYPRVLMDAAFERLSGRGAQANAWRRAERVSESSRTIVRPSPDLHYSACPYDLARGPLTLRVTAWPAYWSVSLYAANSDNYFVLDDREAHDGADITLVRAGRTPPEHAARVVFSPTQRGVALVRRLASSVAEFDAANAAARGDVCGRFQDTDGTGAKQRHGWR